jgi:hypothetical protein
MIPKPQHSVTALGQACGPRLVRLCLHNMLTTIELHYQAVCRATEVSNKGADRVLASELGIMQLSVAQQHPQSALGFGLVTTQAASTISRC